uniref:Uncharacterized protein n=1 Tax=Pipistrellus kuhlii TaxID=59472 RepID=A0A7J7SNS8_PIPKU|nr:hypothetical protein mPipKuh1_009787 [Pipistrellus kuhlii]
MKLDHHPTLNTRINSKWIKGLNVRLGSIKILEQNVDSKVLDVSCSNIFYAISTWNRNKIKKKIEVHQTTSFLHSKGNHQNEKTPLNDTSDKGLISKNVKELIKVNNKKFKVQLKSGQRSPSWVAQLVGASSCTPNGCVFHSQLRHIPRL